MTESANKRHDWIAVMPALAFPPALRLQCERILPCLLPLPYTRPSSSSSFPFPSLSSSRMAPYKPVKIRKETRLAAWYNKLAAFNVEALFAKKREPGPPRVVFVNEDLPKDYYDHRGRVKKEHVYSSNQVVTSKYTFITFLPRNLLEQFRRIANMCGFFIYLFISWAFSHIASPTASLLG